MNWRQRRTTINRLNRIIADIEQLLVDTAWWNDNRAEGEPFDTRPDREVRRLAIAARNAIEQNTSAEAIEQAMKALVRCVEQQEEAEAA